MARKSKAKFTMKGHALPGVNQKSETANVTDGRSPSSAFQQTGEVEGSTPMKSLFGLGKDNKEARQFNREARRTDRDNRQQYRADKKEYRKDKRANNKQYREDMRNYKEELGSNTSKNSLVNKSLSGAERRYFLDNKADYADEFTQLGNMNDEKGIGRRNTVREDYARDYAMDNMPVKGSISNKPSRPKRTERQKLNTSITLTRPETLRVRSKRLRDEGTPGY